MQSNSIFAALGIAFVIFITMRGELRQYMGLLIGHGASAGSAAGSAGGSSASGIATANSILNTALPALGGLGGFDL